MAVNNIKIFPYNLLAEPESIVSVTGSNDDSPASRLYDRYISLLWKYTANVALTFECDQGTPTTELPIDILIIDQHNFGNAGTMDWQYSDGDSTYIEAVTTWTQSDNDQIIKTLSTPITERYWQLLCNSAVLNPYCGEIYMSYGYEFETDINRPPQLSEAQNVKWNMSVGGLERSTLFGEARKSRTYTLNLKTSTQLTNFRTAMGYLDEYSKSFYIKDHVGSYWPCRLTSVPKEQWLTEDLTVVTMSIVEVL